MEGQKWGEITPFGVGLQYEGNFLEKMAFKVVLKDGSYFHL